MEDMLAISPETRKLIDAIPDLNRTGAEATADRINRERSFYAAAFKHKKKRAKLAAKSRKVNRNG